MSVIISVYVWEICLKVCTPLRQAQLVERVVGRGGAGIGSTRVKNKIALLSRKHALPMSFERMALKFSVKVYVNNEYNNENYLDTLYVV